jgi:dTDP-4-dehydrorhamnose 3,5-epimerase-like enzyme
MKLEDRIKIIERQIVMDSRGWFLKVITGKEEHLPQFTGEVYLISANPSESRANHYHNEANEWFTLVQGKAEMIIEDIETKERIVLQLDSEKPLTIYIPHHIAHTFNNLSDVPYIIVTYTDRLFSPKDTVSYSLCNHS